MLLRAWIGLALFASGCWQSLGDGDGALGADADTDGDGDSDADSDIDTDTDSDTDGDGDSDADSDIDADTDVDGDSDTDVDSDADSDADLHYLWHTFHGSAAYEWGYAVAADAAGNVYVAGSSESWTGPSGEAPLHAGGAGGDMYVLALDAEGGYLWHTLYGGAGLDQAAGIAVASDGTLYVAGNADSPWNGPSGEEPVLPFQSPSSYAAALLVLDAGGGYLRHAFLGVGDTYGGPVAVREDGTVYVAGSTSYSWDGPAGESPLDDIADGEASLFAAALSADGDLLWHSFYGPIQGASLALASDGDLLLAGTANDWWVGPEGEAPLHEYTWWMPFYDEIVVIDLDADGAFQWHTFWGGYGIEDAWSVAAAPDGSLRVLGESSYSWVGEGSAAPRHEFDGALGDLFVLALDASGHYLWHTFYGSPGYDDPREIAVGPTGAAYAAGASSAAWSGADGAAPLHGFSGERDLWVLALDSAGEYQWHTFYGGNAYAAAIAADGLGGLLVAGQSSASWFGPGGQAPIHGYTGETDATILKLAE
jgi:hypothetical protein